MVYRGEDKGDTAASEEETPDGMDLSGVLIV